MGTLCLSGAALFKAGVNVSTDLTEAQYDYAIRQAESIINSTTEYNWTNNYATLNADVKYILELACSNLAAVYLVNYDMSGYTSRIFAETTLDVLKDGYNMAIKELKEASKRGFIQDA